eukprot:2214169-Ditylum_brightwellii.AAC.1
MAQLYTTNNNINIATIIKNIKHREEVHRAFASLHYAAKGKQAGCVSHIEIPYHIQNNAVMYEETIADWSFQHPWKEVDDSNDIMDHLITCNKLHLHQAWKTSLANGPLKENVGEYALGQGANEILEGGFDPNKSKNIPAVNYWLKHNICCALPPSLICTNLTVDEFKGLIRIQSEMTSSSPSGQHYGHYKAILTDNSICL